MDVQLVMSRPLRVPAIAVSLLALRPDLRPYAGIGHFLA